MGTSLGGMISTFIASNQDQQHLKYDGACLFVPYYDNHEMTQKMFDYLKPMLETAAKEDPD